MTLQIQQHLIKAIIHHIDGNSEQYEKTRTEGDRTV